MTKIIGGFANHFIQVLAAIILLAPFPVLGESIRCKINHYSAVSQYFLEDGGENNLYKLDLNNVEEQLPTLHNLKRTDLRLIGKRILPGKTFIRIGRHFAYTSKKYIKIRSPKAFFAQLHIGSPHTFVITKDRLIFTETTATPRQEKNKDRLSKHYFISNLQKQVHFAGEFTPYKDPRNNNLFLVFDNGSGTYRPDAKYLPDLKSLLEENFGISSPFKSTKTVYIVTKKFDQKIDKDKLFSFSPHPFKDETIK